MTGHTQKWRLRLLFTLVLLLSCRVQLSLSSVILERHLAPYKSQQIPKSNIREGLKGERQGERGERGECATKDAQWMQPSSSEKSAILLPLSATKAVPTRTLPASPLPSSFLTFFLSLVLPFMLSFLLLSLLPFLLAFLLPVERFAATFWGISCIASTLCALIVSPERCRKCTSREKERAVEGGVEGEGGCPAMPFAVGASSILISLIPLDVPPWPAANAACLT